MSIEKEYNDWSKKNLGIQTGEWYTPYLRRMGLDLREFMNLNGYRDNFFDYDTFQEFKAIYKSITNESEDSIKEIVKGSSKNFPIEIRNKFNIAKEKFALREYQDGNRKYSNDLGGIAGYGTVLRSYLRFLYYYENIEEVYPKSNKKSIDFDIPKVWVYHITKTGEEWDTLYKNGYISLDRAYIGDIKKYESRDLIREIINTNENSEGNQKIHSLAYWQFANEIKVGDRVYVKTGYNKLLGTGFVKSEYYFDENEKEYPHKIDVEWKHKGEWILKSGLTSNTLTNFSSDATFFEYADKLAAGEIGNKTSKNEDFEEWLREQKDESGNLLDDETIKNRMLTIKDVNTYYDVNLFEINDIERLKNLRKKVLIDEENGLYTNNIGNNIVTFESYIQFISTLPIIIGGNESYSKNDFLDEVFVSEERHDEILSILKNKKNIILAGPPGVGKTFVADRLAYSIMGEKDDTRINFIQFHQSYSYEDFIEGFRPTKDGKGFELRSGPFVQFAERALQDPNRDYFMIIDEINRGNLSKIFGELMMLIENDKRGKSLKLLYSNRTFTVPKNLYIIATMNTADRSLALLDYALRRRFSYIELKPSLENDKFENYIKEYEDPETIIRGVKRIKNLNKVIQEKLSTDFMIGHSYFIDEALRSDTKSRLNEILEYEIIPQIKEYWVDDRITANEEVRKLRDFLDDL